MKRILLALFLRLLILISVGGVVSIVGATSHETLRQASKPTVKEAACNFIGDSSTHVYKYPWCPSVKYIKPENKVCFNTFCDACAAGYRPCEGCHPQAAIMLTS